MINNLTCPLNCGLSITTNISNIIIHGAKEHNLKNICFEIPKNKLVALTGPSGSGKSTIANDILQKECIRQYLQSLGMVTDHIKKAKVDTIVGLSPSIGIPQRVTDFNPRSTIGTKSGILTILRNMFATLGHQLCSNCSNFVKETIQSNNKLIMIETSTATNSSSKKQKKYYFNCPHCTNPLEKLQMAHFSYNSLIGACEICKGVGEIIDVNVSLLLHESKTITNGGIDFWNDSLAHYYEKIIQAASKHYNFIFDTTLPIEQYTKEQQNFLFYGINSPDFVKTYKNISSPKKVGDGYFEGIIPFILNTYTKNPEKTPNNIKKYIKHKECITCHGTRLAKLGRETKIYDQTISDITNINLEKLLIWLCTIDNFLTTNELSIFTTFSNALKNRTSHLIDVGLGYLTLNRTLPSLSAGESQRVKLANILGSGLTGVIYVLDEPTTGLHPHDNTKLINTIRKIQESGNTVLIIEHDMDIIKNVDYIIEVGPCGGSKGGEIVAFGTPTTIATSTTSTTSKYLTKKASLPQHSINYNNKVFTIKGASEHNLQHIDVNIPIQQLVIITGVSGSGKSTFLFDIVAKIAKKYLNRANEIPGKYTTVEGLEYFNRTVTINQTSIGHTKSTRSNVATYTKLFDYIRDLFASLPEAKKHHFSTDTFSFNSSSKRCENCNGSGVVDIDMTFMPDIEIVCPTCNGTRFNEEILAIQFKGKNIADILDMTIQDAISLFKDEKKIFTLLKTMKEIGLDYLKLGQSTSTLSGGEAQRIKLAAELCKPETGNTLYLLDEPTTGLHPQEVDKLITTLRNLVSKGNTIIAIEHNMNVIINADTIIDFGPGGGNTGGTIVATGSPKEIITHPHSLTGKALKNYITNLPN